MRPKVKGQAYVAGGGSAGTSERLATMRGGAGATELMTRNAKPSGSSDMKKRRPSGDGAGSNAPPDVRVTKNGGILSMFGLLIPARRESNSRMSMKPSCMTVA